MRKILLVVFLFLFWAVQAWGQGPEEIVTHRFDSKSEEEILNYWTPERIEEALKNPRDLKLEGAPEPVLEAPEPKGPPNYSPPFIPEGSMIEENQPISPGTKDWPCPASAYNTWFFEPSDSYPLSVIGRITFSTPEDDGSCTASLVSSRLVLTAGHCVCENGRWFDNFLFVPGYYNDDYPGSNSYIFRTTYALGGWFVFGMHAYDVAYLVLNNPAGDILGWLGTLTGVNAASQTWTQAGYLPHEQYTSETLAKNVSGFGYSDYLELPPFPIGVGSPFSFGSSGGPWWTTYQGDPYYTNGVNSYGYTGCPYSMHSPYFGDAVWRLIQAALND